MTASGSKGKPGETESGNVSPAHPLANSPVRKAGEREVGTGSYVVLYLHSPREKHWGRLLKMGTAGLWLRGIELESFEAWAREQASDGPGHMGLTTFFVPFLRVDKVALDERVGPVPSLYERFEALAGKSAEHVLSEGG